MYLNTMLKGKTRCHQCNANAVPESRKSMLAMPKTPCFFAISIILLMFPHVSDERLLVRLKTVSIAKHIQQEHLPFQHICHL